MSRIGDGHTARRMAAPRSAVRAAHPRQRPVPVDGSFSVVLPAVPGRQWQVVPGPSGQKLVNVDNKSLAPTDEQIIAVAAPLFMLLIGAMAMFPLII
jgi:hypothetical protein